MPPLRSMSKKVASGTRKGVGWVIKDLPIRVIAACFSMLSFALAVLTGLVSGATATETVGRALFALLGCYVIGLIVGRIAAVAVHEHVAQYRAEHGRDGAEVSGGGDPPVEVETIAEGAEIAQAA